MTSRQDEFSRPDSQDLRGDPALPDSGDHSVGRPAMASSEEIPVNGIRGSVSEEIRSRVLQAVASGQKHMDVANAYGIHVSTIYRWKRQAENKPDASTSGSSEKVEESTPVLCPESPATPSPETSSTDIPRETGRYSKAFKEDVLKQVQSGRKIVEVAAQYAIPEGTITRWKREAREAGGQVPDPKSTRPTSSGPSPINEEHRAIVLSIKEKLPNAGVAQVQNQVKRFHAIRLSRHMIGRIFAEAGIPLQKRVPAECDSDPAKNRFEMSRPNELWAVDFKEIWIHAEKVQALFILDDYSRFCVGHALTQKATAALAIETFETAIQRYGRPERVLSDRGPQFHSWNGVSQFDKFLADFFTDHTVTKAGHCFTNGKVESFNRTIEAELLDVEEFSGLKEAAEKIRSFIAEYNFRRTHMGICNLIPADRYFGMVEEAKQAMEEGLKKAGPGLGWLKGLVSEDTAMLRRPSILQLVLHDQKIELVVLGRRFPLG